MLQTILPRKLYATRWRWFWLGFLWLAPLAYAASAWFALRTDHNTRVGFALDRNQYVNVARAYAQQHGVNAAIWSPLVHTEPNDDLYFYRQAHAASPVWQHLSPVVVRVALQNPELNEIFETFIYPDGRPFGFMRHVKATLSIPPVEEPEARRLAESQLRQRPEARFIPADAAPQLEEKTDNGNLRREYRWKWNAPAAPELLIETFIALQGTQLMRAEIRERIQRGPATGYLREWTPLKITSTVIFWLMVIVLAGLGIFRFVKRARQKELSPSRIAFVSVLIALLLTIVVILTDTASYMPALQMPGRNMQFIIIATSLFMFGILGGLYGLGYGSGEGDLREAYPGKLTSLDALITGRVLSRNVGRSILWGAAWASWLTLGAALLHWPWHRNPLAGHEYSPLLLMAISRSPFLSYLLLWQSEVIQTLVLCLLLPLPWLRRHFKSERTILICLAVIAWIACQNPAMPYRPWSAVLLTAALQAGVVIASFLKFDLLTTASALGLASFTRYVWVLYAQPSPNLHRTSLALLGTVGTILLIAAVCAFKGKWYRDEEVRPVYAGLLAERLSLQADVSAARVAQERLLPQTLPSSPRYAVAAACVPAHEVGGDFFDFFEPDSERLGVLVAEGGGRGLGSALTIAFAKGFLMPKLTKRAQENGRDNSPTESLRGLQTQMNLMLDRDAAAEQNIGLAYAELDTTDGTLRYARTGTHPQALLVRKNSKQAETIDEYELRFAAPNQNDEPIVLQEGRVTLETGDSVVLFTGGIAEAWAEKKRTPAEAAPQLLQHHGRDELQRALFEEIGECAQLVRKQGLGDDLTAVIIRME
jgi:serine phosphatase RsbU (regulator of sigma subunit)